MYMFAAHGTAGLTADMTLATDQTHAVLQVLVDQVY